MISAVLLRTHPSSRQHCLAQHWMTKSLMARQGLSGIMDEGPAEGYDPSTPASAAAMRTRLANYTYNDAETPGLKLEEGAESKPVLTETAPGQVLNIPTKPESLPKKRGASSLHDGSTGPPAKKAKSTTKQRSAGDPYSPENNLVDSLRPDLTLVFIGLNPGLTTALTGHAYAHPSNLFWKLLHRSGVTSIRHDPSETQNLMDLYSIGNTNICKRPTRSGDGLSKEEMIEGAGILEEKIRNMRPEAVCIVGKGIWDTIYKAKTGKTLKSKSFEYGWQEEDMWLGRILEPDGTVVWPGSRTYVTTTTSGLAAGMTPQQKLDIWKPLGEWMQHKRVVKTEDGVEASDENWGLS